MLSKLKSNFLKTKRILLRILLMVTLLRMMTATACRPSILNITRRRSESSMVMDQKENLGFLARPRKTP